MGTIVNRTRKDGTVVYSAQILLKRKGAIVHRETQTFAKRQAAVTWMRRREGELAAPDAIDRLRAEDPPLGKVIGRYIAEAKTEFGRAKRQGLQRIRNYPIAAMPCSKIRAQHLIELADDLAEGRKPQTVAQFFAYLGPVFGIARPAWGYRLDDGAVKDALKVLRKMGMVGKSEERNRRPTLDEMDLLMEHFTRVERQRPQSSPMTKIIPFAMFSTRRQDEICRIVRPDLDEARSRVWVRDMKHPGDKSGNDVRCNLPPEALAIIKTIPERENEPRIFPYDPQSISTAFTRACKLLGIVDLVFHDLRHDGISRLFEMGNTIPEVAAVSGHRQWKSLQRYTHLDHVGDKYEGWAWKERFGLTVQR